MKSSLCKLCLVAILSVISLGLSAAADALRASDGKDYTLGPQDELQIRVYDLRTSTGDEHEWTALTGSFTIGASGNLSLPLLGEIRAGGLTVTAVANTLEQMLQAKVGLAQRPNASIEIAKYRPFYVVGAVDKPGEYSYRPGMTVLQSMAIAGGLRHTSESNEVALARDALVNKGELRVLTAERTGLLTRQARLDAELKRAETITFPDEIRLRMSDPDVARSVSEETSLLATNNEALKAQADILTKARALGLQEVASLGEKAKSLSGQLELTKKELALVSGLVAKGLAVVPRQLAIEQTVAQFESSQLDVQLASLRAQQDISRIDRELAQLSENRVSLVLTESGQVRSKLAESAERMTTARNLLRAAETQADEISREGEAEKIVPMYSITRSVAGTVSTFGAGEADLVEPGDTVRVERQWQIRSANRAD